MTTLSSSRSTYRPRSQSTLAWVALPLLFLVWASFSTPAQGQPSTDGAAFLAANQQADGSWLSLQVRPEQATTEALRALRASGLEAGARAAAATLLDTEPALDTDDRARRLAPLAAEGRDVAGLLVVLTADASDRGGWGLSADFSADPLDTALALAAVASQPTVGNAVLLPALGYLVSVQNTDGGWPCVAGGLSEIFCTSHAMLGLAGYQSRFAVLSDLDEGAAYLSGLRNLDGSFGAAGANLLIHSALASTALAAIPAVGPELGAMTAFLGGLQQTDGSWQGDPYPTALALRALAALATVPVCGDGAINQPGELCDGLDLAGASCETLGLGTGTLACNASCGLDTSSCTGPPVCGDGEINQATEACDGLDFGALTCESLGLGPGDLACTSECSLDTLGCSAPPTCGDGVINQATESCDGSDLGGQGCVDVGFLGGVLACNPDCTFDAAGCEGVPFCGDGEINRPEEECDGTDLAGQSCDSLGFGGGTLACSSSCILQTGSCLGSGAIDPSEIVLEPSSAVCVGGSETVPATITFPPTSVVDRVDVFLLFDDTGSFAGRVPQVRNIFNQLVGDLQAGLPEISFSFGVGRFEDYGGSQGRTFSSENSTGRPFTLNQPLITPDLPDFLALINGALSRSAPGFGGDGPETNFEALFQIATGAGFDGNGNGSNLDSGVAGNALTQVSPGTSGDVPGFDSNIAPTVGGLGGVGFRPGALHLVIQAGDICSVAPFAASEPIPTTLTGAGGATVPTTAIACSSSIGSSRFGRVSDSISRFGNTVAGAIAPLGSAPVPATIDQLNALGISVIGLAPGGTAIRNPVGPSGSSSVLMSALALLTGAVDETGLPLVFNISGGTGPLRDAVVRAVTTAATRPVDVSLRPATLPDGLSFSFTPEVVTGVGPGESATFDVTFTGDGSSVSGPGAIEFFDTLTNGTLATLPIEASCQPSLEPPDGDGDGFPEDEDCDDTDPNVNPGAEEIPGNGIDDDCNPITPDVLPLTAALCNLFSLQVVYDADELATFDGQIENLDEEFTLNGLSARLRVFDEFDLEIFAEERLLAPLPPASLSEQTFSFAPLGVSPGDHLALLEIFSGDQLATMCSAGFRIESSALSGAGLSGTLSLNPDLVDSGQPSDALYTLTNQGNTPLVDLGVRVLLLDPDSEQVVGELLDQTAIAVGDTFTGNQLFTTTGLPPKTYLALLIGVLAGSGLEQTLDSDLLEVVNVPPDCSAVFADLDRLWPPNHAMVEIAIEGVVDADGDPITLTVLQVFQDEPVDSTGDGAFCPDATGTGTPSASVRRERSGGGDGRVYHLGFIADDGRGGTCEAVVTVCVPHDRRPGSDCVDQGPLFDSTICP